MADLNDKQAAIESCMNHYEVGNKEQNSVIDWCVDMLTDLPSADIDLSGFSDKLWAAAYERGKADAVRSINERGDMISRQAAIDVLEERLQANGYSNVALVSELNRSIGYLMRLPSADVVEVVRCKDCKWFNDIGCAIRIVDDSDKPTENDYCSYGERNDG